VHKSFDLTGFMWHSTLLAAKELPWWCWLIVGLAFVSKCLPSPTRRRRRAIRY
jgi:hypothetical protein